MPSSWSAALDQICAGAESDDTPKRLIVVSAGNLQLDVRHEYPDRNLVEGVEDPAQSWNCLTVGGFTERTSIHEPDYEEWNAIAPYGRLSPASRTSRVWNDKSWPLKPDIVMEGGNNAIDPSTGRADFVDDLSLLTTRVDPTGALLTTTGDTSGATALASRYAAIIWARYPNLWPESVRAILIHSARWSEAMLEEFPGNTSADRESRLRCYGFGVPNLPRALSSLSNAATLVVEGSLQPFDMVEETDDEGRKQKKVKTKDMHLHQLPWPSAVLQAQGELTVRMRVTLSYLKMESCRPTKARSPSYSTGHRGLDLAIRQGEPDLGLRPNSGRPGQRRLSYLGQDRRQRTQATRYRNAFINPGENVGGTHGEIHCLERLGGVLRYYERRAA